MLSYRNSLLFLMFIMFTAVWINHTQSLSFLNLESLVHSSQQAGISKRKMKSDFILDGSQTKDRESQKLMSIIRIHHFELSSVAHH